MDSFVTCTPVVLFHVVQNRHINDPRLSFISGMFRIHTVLSGSGHMWGDQIKFCWLTAGHAALHCVWDEHVEMKALYAESGGMAGEPLPYRQSTLLFRLLPELVLTRVAFVVPGVGLQERMF